MLRAFDLSFFGQLLGVAFSIKEDPVGAGRLYQPLFCLIAIVVLIAVEMMSLVNWWRSRSGSLLVKAQRAAAWMATLLMWRKLLCYVVAAVGCIMLIASRGREPEPDGAGDYTICALLAIAALFQGNYTINSFFVPFKKRGIFALSIEAVLWNDVALFLTFLALFLINYWVALYIAYPRAGEGELMAVPAFNSWTDSLKAMVEMGLSLGKFKIELGGVWMLDADQQANMGVYLAIYLYAVVILVILLLRFLMAMLTARFNSIKKDAELEWRVQFARHTHRT